MSETPPDPSEDGPEADENPFEDGSEADENPFEDGSETDDPFGADDDAGTDDPFEDTTDADENPFDDTTGADTGDPFDTVGDASDADTDDPFEGLDDPPGTGVDNPFEDLDDASAPAIDDPFEEMEMPDVDTEAVLETVLDDDAGRTLHGSGADGVVPKEQYCKKCEHFSEPPETACTNPGTEIVELVGVDSFRLRNCPVVADRQRTESVFPDEE